MDILNFQLTITDFLRIRFGKSSSVWVLFSRCTVSFPESESPERRKIDNFPHINKTTSFFYFIFSIIPCWLAGVFGDFWNLGTVLWNGFPYQQFFLWMSFFCLVQTSYLSLSRSLMTVLMLMINHCFIVNPLEFFMRFNYLWMKQKSFNLISMMVAVQLSDL